MCLSISYAAAACSGKRIRCSIKPSTDYAEFFCVICVICGLLLPVDPIAIVTADGTIVAEATGLQALRRIDDEASGADAVEKLPDASNDLLANSLPVVVRED